MAASPLFLSLSPVTRCGVTETVYDGRLKPTMVSPPMVLSGVATVLVRCAGGGGGASPDHTGPKSEHLGLGEVT
ncbi:hypothetical protein LY76DRAFT_242963 [Colletotrichum caudatum]|nr:hypothetical protein LY76DRAFT_242963 [Colletotrichum caudatum]